MSDMAIQENSETLAARVRELEAQLASRERLLAESQAREARYRQLVECNMVGMLFWHTDGRILDANDFVLNLIGYTREDLEQGRINWASMTPPEFAVREAEAHRQLAERGVCAPFEKQYIRKDGSRVPILIGGALLRGSQDEGVCFLLDVSDRKQVERELANSKQLFEAFMENIPAVAFIKNAQGERVYLNRHYQDLFSDGSKLLGKSDDEMFGPQLKARLQQEDAAVLATNGVRESILDLPTADGMVRKWLTYKFPVQDDRGTLIGGVAIDISELTRAKEQLERVNEELEERVASRTAELEHANEELRSEIVAKEHAQAGHRKSESRFRKWLDQSVVPTQVMGKDGYTRQVNHAWERLWGGTLADMEGFNLLTDSQTEERGITAYLRRALAGEAVYVPEVPFVPDRGIYKGQARWCSGVIYPVKDDITGEIDEIVILHQDVTDRIAAEEKLRLEERTLRKLLDLQDQERKLIAYEIHDGLVQELIGAQMLLEAYAQECPHERVHQVAALLRRGINEARRLINGLRPLVIDEQGVVNAIEFLIAEEEARGGLTIQFFHHVTFDRLPPLVEGSLYRIVQECLNNARRHSGSKEVEVWLHEDNRRLKLLVRDYGCGFDVKSVPDDRFGLESISRRAQIFGGASEIESHPGEGTTVRVEIPLESA